MRLKRTFNDIYKGEVASYTKFDPHVKQSVQAVALLLTNPNRSKNVLVLRRSVFFLHQPDGEGAAVVSGAGGAENKYDWFKSLFFNSSCYFKAFVFGYHRGNWNKGRTDKGQRIISCDKGITKFGAIIDVDYFQG